MYRGLTVGKSTIRDMFRVLGKPVWSGHSDDESHPPEQPTLYEFSGQDDLSSKIDVSVDHGVITSITLRPSRPITKEKATKLFGKDYIIVQYDFDERHGMGESVPVCESPDGEFESIEYRHKGISLWILEDLVSEIEYLPRPRRVPRCKSKPKAKSVK